MEIFKNLFAWIKAFPLYFKKENFWEKKLVGKNIHSVFTLCRTCGMHGINMPFEDSCGNCGSKDTVRYYDKKTIDLLFKTK
jgi:ribosomal protein L37E